jgi:single-strand DNA-binding protein
MLNKVMLIGRLTRDPEMRYTQSGQPVTSLSLATNRYWNDRDGNRQEGTDFHDVVCWNQGRRNLAEIVAQYTHKGALVYVEGRLQTRSWDDQNTGQKRYKTEVVAENVQFLEPRGSQSGAAPVGAQSGGPGPQPMPSAPPPPTRDVDPDDIPF